MSCKLNFLTRDCLKKVPTNKGTDYRDAVKASIQMISLKQPCISLVVKISIQCLSPQKWHREDNIVIQDGDSISIEIIS